jgi:hypothetical protein
MRTIIFVCGFFLWNSAAVFSQADKKPLKAAVTVQQSTKPSLGAQAPRLQTAKPAAVQAASKPKTGAATKGAPAPSADLEKFKAEQEKLKAEQEKLQKAQELVREWFRRWNTLDGTEDSVNRFVEMYEPDATHLVGPRENQIGPVFYEGHDLIRKMAEKVSQTYSRLAYYIKVRTVNEKTAELLLASPTPWGGAGVMAEFGASYDVRESKKRFMVPGAAFFEIQDEKISRVRVYYASGETAEVIGAFTAGCGN